MKDFDDQYDKLFAAPKTWNALEKEIWNDAIEAVIKLINSNKYYDRAACTIEDEIRELKNE